MALRLRRGTEAQRTAQTVPFQDGELVWITDTKKLYAGDGTTLGGIPVDIANSDFSIDFLNDVDTTSVGFAPTDGQALVWDNTESTWRPGNVALSEGSIGDLSDVDITSQAPTTGQVLKWNAAQSKFVPGDDTANSGLVVDDIYQIAINGDVYAADGTSKVLENGTDGSDATFTGVVTAGAGSSLVGNVTGDVYAADGTSKVLENGADGTDATFTGSVIDNNGTTVVDATTGDITVNNLNMAGGTVTGSSFTVGTDSILAFTQTEPGANGWFNLAGYYDGAEANRLTGIRSRGTIFAPTSVVDGDGLLAIAVAPYDGSTYLNGGAIRYSAAVDGPAISTNVAITVRDGAAASTATVLEADAEKVQFTSVPAVPAYADASARDTAITNPTVGMIVITGANFQGYTGSTWVNLN